MPDHTKLPWCVAGVTKMDVRQRCGRMVAYTGPNHKPPDEYPPQCAQEDRANALFIVRACNSFPELIRHLKLILEVSERNSYADYREAVREIATSALQKAEQITPMPDDRFPPELLLPITSEDAYDKAVKKLNELLDIEQSRQHTVEEAVYLDLLGDVIEAWDEAHPITGDKDA